MGFQPFNPSVAGFANPMTTAGDLIDGGTAGAAQRLAVGTTGQVLTVAGGAPSWAAAGAGFANPMTTAGDMIDATTGGAAQRLAIGTTGQVLTVVAGAPAWNAAWTQAAPVSFTPANPTATANTAVVMMGLGSTCTYTPAGSGTVLAIVTGFFTADTGSANVTLGCRYGSGTAPAGSFTATATNASPCVFTAAGSAYANNTIVQINAQSSIPTGFTAATNYYVVSAAGTSFSLSATSGGTAINSTSTGSGVYVGQPTQGTRFGSAADPALRSASDAAVSGFAYNAVIVSLTPGTPYWFDLAAATSNAADIAVLSNISMSFAELP